jgi:hypothetical protein
MACGKTTTQLIQPVQPIKQAIQVPEDEADCLTEIFKGVVISACLIKLSSVNVRNAMRTIRRFVVVEIPEHLVNHSDLYSNLVAGVVFFGLYACVFARDVICKDKDAESEETGKEKQQRFMHSGY